jgi:uncharacterized protein (UPF0335 family)
VPLSARKETAAGLLPRLKRLQTVSNGQTWRTRMARERKAAIGDNTIKPDLVAGFTSRIETLLGNLDSRKGEYMREARGIRDEINGIYGEAKDAGIPKKEFRAVIKARGLERKLDGIREDLEGDEVETFDQIYNALGDLADTPLGKAALDKAGDQPAA